MITYCPYCKCIILPNGKCRNEKCILGISEMATIKQLELIYQLCSELEIDVSKKDPNKLTKQKASKLIDDLIARKTLKALEEVDY